jgi:DNA-binding SARP family transcriptional activator
MELLSADLLGLRGRIFCARGQYRRAVSFLSQAVERLSARPGSPRLVEFRATLAWCELRAGRLRVARDHLDALIEPADRGANDYERTQVHYWLAEALLGLGQAGQADAHLSLALRLARERGYEHFLRVQAREEPAPLLHALARRIEPDVCAHALAECGNSVERALLELLPGSEDEIAEAVIAVLGEVGGPASRAALEPLAGGRPALRPAIRPALHHLEERLGRITTAADAGAAPRLFLFGPPRIEFGGRPLPASAWRAQRAFQMLVYLALHPRGATRDELLDVFWPARRLAAGRRNFHPTLSYIRSVLPRAGAPPLLREAEIYRLNPEYPLGCDFWDFEAALDSARGASEAPERRRMLDRAVAACGAPLLEGFYGDWAGDISARVRDQVETARLELGALCLEAGDAPAALGHFRAAAELDPYRESTRVCVIECLIRLGNRRAAIVEFDRLKGLLRAELSVDPLPETDEAVRRLMAGALGEPSAEPQAAEGVPSIAQPPIKPPARGWRA